MQMFVCVDMHRKDWIMQITIRIRIESVGKLRAVWQVAREEN